MIARSPRLLVALLLLVLLPATTPAADMRSVNQKAREERIAAEQNATRVREEIRNNRSRLEARIRELTQDNARLDKANATLETRIGTLMAEKARLSSERSRTVSNMKAVSGTIRTAARELDGITTESPLTADTPNRLDTIRPILGTGRFAGIDDIAIVTDGFFDEIDRTGEVELRRGDVLAPGGGPVAAEILTIGPFTAAYRLENGDTGFLRYLPENRKFQMLGRAPSRAIRKNLAGYMNGERDDVATDVSGGAALQQILHRSTLKSQIANGGLLVWPILLIGLIALLVAIERFLCLHRVHENTDRIMGQVNDLAAAGDWDGCDAVVREKEGKPVFNILIAGLSARKEDRQTLESILQEAILRELPRLERFLPMLNVMAGIAPLIGLLGTVTGMIRTFHTITLFGTGDPRMMSGGISEALVTTMFGLAVAIPITLIHTFLTRQVEHIAGDMEEKAVALCNVLTREHLPICCKKRMRS